MPCVTVSVCVNCCLSVCKATVGISDPAKPHHTTPLMGCPSAAFTHMTSSTIPSSPHSKCPLTRLGRTHRIAMSRQKRPLQVVPPLAIATQQTPHVEQRWRHRPVDRDYLAHT
mmetsp:Transcript_40000/g.100099  ORF Transcript_40000/g.100099 Transcript_40000/m.100099 type:complete len:113 (+) Transcript_40000:1457-1795(+)